MMSSSKDFCPKPESYSGMARAIHLMAGSITWSPNPPYTLTVGGWCEGFPVATTNLAARLTDDEDNQLNIQNPTFTISGSSFSVQIQGVVRQESVLHVWKSDD